MGTSLSSQLEDFEEKLKRLEKEEKDKARKTRSRKHTLTKTDTVLSATLSSGY